MYENDFINMLNKKSDNTDSMVNLQYIVKLKKMYIYLDNNVLCRHITGIGCSSNLMPVNH